MLWAFAAACLWSGCRGHAPDRPAAEGSVESGATLVSAVQSPTRTNESVLPASNVSATAASADTLPDNILAWDARDKTYKARPEEDTASFRFNVTNVSPAAVVIGSTATSCGCTVAELPADPWVLSPGGHGQLAVTMDLDGQTGTVVKEVMVFTSSGNVSLTVTSIVPDPEPAPGAK